jgi:hypothetical protein
MYLRIVIRGGRHEKPPLTRFVKEAENGDSNSNSSSGPESEP